MKFRNLNFFLLIFFAFPCFVTRNTAAQTFGTQAEVETAKISEDNLVHFGDLIDVDVLGSYEYDWRGAVTPEGFLDGAEFSENPIYALCRSEDEIARAVETGYSKLLKNPQVVVKIIDRSNRPLTELSGAVKMPQRFQIRRTIFLNELLILSGGLTENASGQIQIFRPANLSCANPPKSASNSQNTETTAAAETQIIKINISDLLSGKTAANPKIYNGDLITVLASEAVYLIGGVQNPKQISMRNQMTLSRAVDSAGGISKNGRAEAVTVFRRENGVTNVIAADLTKIKNHQADDMLLKAQDIIEVGEKGGSSRKYPPVIRENNAKSKNNPNLPLTIIE